jgi:hypothetical protein
MSCSGIPDEKVDFLPVFEGRMPRKYHFLGNRVELPGYYPLVTIFEPKNLISNQRSAKLRYAG